jgi:molybdopterin converting factor subunit 1
MIVRVRLFAVAKERAGTETLEIELPDNATIVDLRQRISEDYPGLRGILAHAMWAVDTVYADEKTILNAKSEVAMIPPVSGG